MLDTHAKKTVTQTNLQALIAEIDSFLSAPSLPEPEQQRQILQQVRHYLVSLENSNTAFPTDEIVRQISQSIIASVNSNLSQSFEKLQQELDGFHHHRDFLLQEIEQLETKQQQLISELTATFEQQVNQVRNFEISLQENNQQTTADRIANLIQLQETVDQILMSFDATFRTVFETLERDLEGYQKSLSQGLENIHNLGQKSEVTVRNYVGNLGEQLEQPIIDSPLPSKETPSIQTYQEIHKEESKFPEIIPETREIQTEIQTETQIKTDDYPQEEVAIPALPTIEEEILTKPTILEEKKFHNLPTAKIGKKQILNPDIETIKALTDIIDPEAHFKEEKTKELWYLGIDFGTVGMAAVLFHSRVQGHKCIPLQQCPIYWSYKYNEQYNSTFRLPTDVYSRHPSSPFLLGILASETDKEKGFVLENFKPYLDLIPLADQEPFPWQPLLDKGEEFLSLAWVQQAIQELFGTLSPIKIDNKAESELYDLTIDAIGLSKEALNSALGKLSGIVFSSPVNWSDTYRFNVRETVLQMGLVKDAGQIFFMEEPVANLLAHLPINPEPLLANILPRETKIGTTLVINAGAAKTEFILTELPENPQQLSYWDLILSSWDYGDQSFTQDILCHLLYSEWMSQLHPSLSNLELEVPEVGQPEVKKRQQLSLCLQSTPIGKSLLKAAETVKIILQEREEFTSNLGTRQWSVKRQDLEEKVTQPVLEQISSQIHQLLQLSKKSPDEITQIVCSGGMSVGLGEILSDYLKNQFPNVNVVQDGEEDNSLSVAMGLSRLPLFPLILDRPRHQYSDYFLLLEMLQTLPNNPFTIEDMMRMLQRRGVNARVCSDRIISILEGNLPLKTEFSPFAKGENDYYHADLEQCEKLRQYFQYLLSQTQQKLTEPLVANLA